MTLPATSKAFTDALPPEEAQAVANQLRQVLASARDGDAELYSHSENEGKVRIELHPLISDVLIDLLRLIGSGDAVTLVPISKMLTTQQAADILNVSRPYFIKLLDQKSIPYHFVGRHRRIKAHDLFEYKKVRMARRSEALDELAAMDGELI